MLGCVSMVIWIVLVFVRGGFWRLHLFDGDTAEAATPRRWPRVVAVVPARNEGETIGAAVASLIQQKYPGEFSIILADDHSVDGTAEIARRTAMENHARDRMTVHSAAPLPAGWTGKLWALNQGIASAAVAPTDFFWFSDADIVHAPDALQRLVARAERNNLDLTSQMVLLRAKTFSERLLIPAFLYFFLKLYPPRWIADPRARTAGAAGGCILLRNSAHARIGGIAAIRSEVIDDCALARAVKRTGGRIWMGVTRKSFSLCAYQSFAEIHDMIARTAFTQLRYSSLRLLGTLAALFFTYLAPLVLLFSHRLPARLLGAAGLALMSLSYLPTVRFYRLSPLWAPLLPLAALFYSYATWLSAVRYWLGRGAQWKGRAQAPRST